MRLEQVLLGLSEDPSLTHFAVKDETTPSGVSPAPQAQQAPPPQVAPLPDTADPVQRQAQEEYIRTMFRAQETQAQQSQQGQQGQEGQEDPMMKLFNSIVGGAEGADPDNPTGLPFSPEDVSKATGLPSFVTDMVFGKQEAPPTPAQEKTARVWKLIHVLFSVLAGIYLIFVLDSSTKTFGTTPPPPATIQNPFLVFIMGELLVQGSQMVIANKGKANTAKVWLQILKDVAGDGSIVVFMMGASSWYKGSG